MIDIHCHLLPGVDDGAGAMADSIGIVKNALLSGVHTIVCTPHILDIPSPAYIQQIQHSFAELQQYLIDEQLPMEIVTGAEFLISPDVPALVKQHTFLTLNGTGKYVLVEFPLNEIPSYAEEVLFELCVSGITPIIAHPERYFDISDDLNILVKFIQGGALCQLNAGSLLGRYGKRIRKTSKQLIAHGLVHIIASDSHSARSVYPLSEALSITTKMIGRKHSQNMVTSIPASIIRGSEIQRIVPKPIKKSIFRNLLHI